MFTCMCLLMNVLVIYYFLLFCTFPENLAIFLSAILSTTFYPMFRLHIAMFFILFMVVFPNYLKFLNITFFSVAVVVIIVCMFVCFISYF